MAEAFENLNCWKRAKNLCLEIYKIIDKFPKIEEYSLKDQLRRAAISVPSNIAEGLSRISSKEQYHFFTLSIGSIYEIMTQIDIARELGYIEMKDKVVIFNKSNEVIKLINGYKKYLMK